MNSTTGTRCRWVWARVLDSTRLAFIDGDAQDGAFGDGDSEPSCRTTSDKANARIEHDQALQRVLVELMKDDTQLFQQWNDDESFRRWLADTVFDTTYWMSA